MAPVAQLADVVHRAPAGEAVAQPAEQLRRAGLGITTDADQMVRDAVQRRTRLHLLLRQAVHLREQLIAHDQALLGIEHGDAV
jgi:hypothetical protein